MSGKSVPVLRFPGFKNDWEMKKLGQYMSFKNGVNADKSSYGTGYKFINVLDIISGSPIYYESILGKVKISEKDFDKNKVQYGDLLFQRSSEIREEAGQANVYLDKEKSATFGGFVIRGHPKSEFDSVFFYYLLQTHAVRKDITSRSGGSTRFNVGQDSLSAVSVNVCPTLPEQQKIAAFLSAVDNKLSALRRKHELLQTYKRGVMQKIFSRELRFKADDGGVFPEWVERRLGELGRFTGGGTPSTENKDYWTGTIPWVSSSDINENSIHYISVTRFISEKAVKESATKIVPANSILLISRVGVGKLAITYKPVCTSQDFSSFTPKTDNVIFLAYMLRYHKNKLLSFAQGTSIKGFTGSDISRLKIHQPCIEEQQKIANFLTAIDRKIEAVAAQIEKMEAFKKGLLQQMFV